MGKQNDGITTSSDDFKLVGDSNFVRSNPRSDRFPVRRFHHVEFWCTDATNASRRFSWGLGMPVVAKSDLSTGNATHASYLCRSGDLCFLFTAPYSPSISASGGLGPPSMTSLPTFSYSACVAFAAKHGLAIRAIAVEVEDADAAFHISITQGTKPVSPPVILDGAVTIAEVHLYGDVVLRYVSYKTPASNCNNSSPDSWFLPRFEPTDEVSSFPLDIGIRRLDHAVVCVHELGPAVSYVKRFTGFHEFAEFTKDDVGTDESGLNSVVLANNDKKVLLTICEPVFGTKRRSQIQTYLEHNEGPGVQHLALMSEDIFRTLREMRKRSGVGGFEFMPPPPPTYYRNLKGRAGDVLTDEQIKECEELGILVDRDHEGILFQIFTKPVGDRPTLFLEIIQRVGCMLKDDHGELNQEGGCGGFGKGNIAELFKSLEEYEKTLDARHVARPASA
ncbi:4-hydroxyphenylpyruvate dioxygenase-like [Syzygium oleosum]|uniref:4-hydroxyphenylpyruvate dioxygenase-like n=1 Tax=Syzygium oleosum TaxID=219896 RepID=UPI0024B96AC4|nr:4-hydroxyphenylpyruvate dioxygenase-like [Syzygium oleosum]